MARSKPNYPYEPLSERETLILRLMADGLSHGEIAVDLGISLNTVKWHVQHIYDKLDAKRRSQAVAVARSSGLLDGATPGHDSPETDSEGRTRHNLPPQPTTFIGRQEEIEAISRLLDDPACRLLTLAGPGGIGKTRLAIEVAFRRQALYPDGVFFVPLQPLTTHEHIAPAIASSIGLHFQPDDRSPQQQLMDYFGGKSLLLLMDNFEHLLAGVDLVYDLLVATPGVKVMTTSREALNLREEYLNQVSGLQVPDHEQIEASEAFSAVELFADRARRVYPEFALSAELPDVVGICRLVEGMPLAIELAATWVNTLSCAEISDEIRRSLDILATPLRNVPERHQSMQAVFDHSWQLLTEAERTVFRRLSVFRGGCTREAAEAVTEADLTVLRGLVDKSFIGRDAQGGRYAIHELLRQYGESQLELDADEDEVTCGRHVRYYAELVYEHEAILFSRIDYRVVDIVHGEQDNIDRAWRQALEQDMIEDLGKFPALMDYYCQARGLYTYADAMYGQTADLLRAHPPGEIRDRALGRVLRHWGWTFHLQGRDHDARSLLQESLPLLDRPQWAHDLALSIGFLGDVKRTLGELAQAKQLLQEAYAVFKSLKTPLGIWMSQQMLGNVAQQTGEWEAAKGHVKEALRVAEGIGSTVGGYMYALPLLGMTHSALGEFPEARQCLRQALAINREILDTLPCSLTLAGIVQYLLAQERDAEAFEVLMIIVEHPLYVDYTGREMRPYLANLTDKLPPEATAAARQRAEVVLEATRRSYSHQYLPPTYFDQLERLLEEPSPPAEDDAASALRSTHADSGDLLTHE